MVWMPYIKTAAPVVVVDALRRACLQCNDWKSRPENDCYLHAALAADYIGKEFIGENLGLVAIAWEDEPERVVVTMHAHRWGKDRSHASDEEYARAERLAAPLLNIAGNLLGRRLRLCHPPADRVRPLRGVLADALHGVTAVYQIWQERQIRALHPTEYERFWRFIHVAHQVQSVLRPRDVAAHLTAAGLDQDLVEKLQREYEIGRQVLAVHSAPWDLRRIRKERRQRWKAELDAEMARFAAGHAPS